MAVADVAARFLASVNTREHHLPVSIQDSDFSWICVCVCVQGNDQDNNRVFSLSLRKEANLFDVFKCVLAHVYYFGCITHQLPALLTANAWRQYRWFAYKFLETCVAPPFIAIMIMMTSQRWIICAANTNHLCSMCSSVAHQSISTRWVSTTNIYICIGDIWHVEHQKTSCWSTISMDTCKVDLSPPY